MTTPIRTVLHPSVEYGKVTWWAVTAVADATDADLNPDSVAVQGTVTFTPVANELNATTAKQSIFPRPITCPIGADGQLMSPGGGVGVNLVATNDPDVQASAPWFYRVTFSLVGLTRDPMTIAVPRGSVQDLRDAIIVGGTPTDPTDPTDPVIVTVDGGTPATSGTGVLDGGSPTSSGTGTPVDGGGP